MQRPCAGLARGPAAWASEKIAQYYDDPHKRRSDTHSFRTSIFAKRAALGRRSAVDRVPLGYYAGALGRHFLEHGAFASMPAATAVTGSAAAKA